MWIILIILGITVGSYILAALARKGHYTYYWTPFNSKAEESFVCKFKRFHDYPLYLIATIGAVILLLLMIGLMFTYVYYYSFAAEHIAIQETIDAARENEFSDLERAAVVTTIIERNKDLARAHMWMQTSFRIFYPSFVEDIEYIE